MPTSTASSAEQLGVPVQNVFSTLGTYLGSTYINDFNLSRPHLARDRAGRCAASRRDRRHRAAQDTLRLRHDGAARFGDDTAGTPAAPGARCATISTRPSRCRAIRRPAIRADNRLRPCSGSRRKSCRRASLPNGPNSPSSRSRLATRGIFVFGLSVVFVFLLLAANYESLVLPLAVILIVPMCLLAAILGVNLMGRDNNILTQIGLVVLVGLAAKNAILIVEFAKRGEELDKLDSARRRRTCRAPAAAADPDDLRRVYFGDAAAGHRHRSRLRDAPGARHCGVLRHDRRDVVRACCSRRASTCSAANSVSGRRSAYRANCATCAYRG